MYRQLSLDSRDTEGDLKKKQDSEWNSAASFSKWILSGFMELYSGGTSELYTGGTLIETGEVTLSSPCEPI